MRDSAPLSEPRTEQREPSPHGGPAPTPRGDPLFGSRARVRPRRLGRALSPGAAREFPLEGGSVGGPPRLTPIARAKQSERTKPRQSQLQTEATPDSAPRPARQKTGGPLSLTAHPVAGGVSGDNPDWARSVCGASRLGNLQPESCAGDPDSFESKGPAGCTGVPLSFWALFPAAWGGVREPFRGPEKNRDRRVR